MFVALPQDHVLCVREEINWGMLCGEQIILCQSEKGRILQDELIKSLARLNDRPKVERLQVGRETLMHLVASRLGLTLATEATVATQFPGVVFRPIAGDDAVLAFGAVWSRTNDNPTFRRFPSTARNVARRWKVSAGTPNPSPPCP